MLNKLHIRYALLVPLIAVATFLAIFLYYYKALDIGSIEIDLSPRDNTLATETNSAETSGILSLNAKAMTRIHWGISCIALVSSCLLSIVVSFHTIYSTLSTVKQSVKRSIILQTFGFVVICSMIIGYAGKSFELSGGVGEALYNLVCEVAKLNTEPTIDITTGIIAFTSLMIAFVCSSLCIKPENNNFVLQRKFINLYNLSSITTAIALSIGIIQIFLLYKFHTSYINNETEREILLSGMTFSVSIFYTNFFSLLYIPVLYILRRRSIQLITQPSESQNEKSLTEQLNSKGINFSLKKIIQYVSLFTSPILVGLATKIMEHVLST